MKTKLGIIITAIFIITGCQLSEQRETEQNIFNYEYLIVNKITTIDYKFDDDVVEPLMTISRELSKKEISVLLSKLDLLNGHWYNGDISVELFLDIVFDIQNEINSNGLKIEDINIKKLVLLKKIETDEHSSTSSTTVSSTETSNKQINEIIYYSNYTKGVYTFYSNIDDEITKLLTIKKELTPQEIKKLGDDLRYPCGVLAADVINEDIFLNITSTLENDININGLNILDFNIINYTLDILMSLPTED